MRLLAAVYQFRGCRNTSDLGVLSAGSLRLLLSFQRSHYADHAVQKLNSASEEVHNKNKKTQTQVRSNEHPPKYQKVAA